jgi:hypothetical protein
MAAIANMAKTANRPVLDFFCCGASDMGDTLLSLKIIFSDKSVFSAFFGRTVRFMPHYAAKSKREAHHPSI